MSYIETVVQGIGGSAASGITAADSWYVSVTDGTNVLGTSGHPVVVSGTVAVSGTVPVSSTQLPAALDGSGNLKVAIESGSVTIGSAVTANQGSANTAANAWPVYETVSGAAIDPRSIRALTSADIVSLPTGQVTTLTPPTAAAIGTAVAAPSAAAIASAIVANPPTTPLPTAQVTTLTPPTASAIGTAVAGALANPLPVHDAGIVEISATSAANTSGNPLFVSAAISNSPAVTVTSGSITATQATGTNLHTVVDSGSVTLTGSPAISGTVTANQGTAAALSSAWPVETVISGAVVDPREIGDGTSVMGLMTNFGTTPGAVKAIVANASLAIGTTMVSASAPVPVSATAAANNSGNPLYVSAAISNSPAVTVTSGSITATQATGTNLHTVVDSGTVIATQATAANLNATIVGTGTFAVQAAQSGSWTATVTQATGTNLHAVIDSGSVTITGTPAISGTVTANQGTANTATNAWPTYTTVSGAAIDPRQIRALTSADVVSLPTAQVTTLTPPTAAAIGTAVASSLTVGSLNVAITAGNTQYSPGISGGPFTGNLMLGLIGTATAALSLDSNSNLEINDNTRDISQATQNITAADIVSVSTAWYNNEAAITGTPTALSTASFAINGDAECRIQMTGTLVGTVQIEYSVDGGTTWFSLALNVGGKSINTVTGASSPLTNFVGTCNVSSVTNVRVRCTTFTSGTGTVLVRTGNFTGSVGIGNSLVIHDPTTPGNNLGVGPTWGTAYTSNGTANVNASLAVGTTMATAATFGTTAAGTGILSNSSLFAGTTAVRSNQTTTAAGVLDVNIVGNLGVTNSKTNPIFTGITDGTNNMGTMTTFGVNPTLTPYALNTNSALFAIAASGGAPTPLTCSVFGSTSSGIGLGVNASLFLGTSAISSTVPLPISATSAANAQANPIYVRLTDGTTSVTAAVSAFGAAPTGTEVMAVNASLFSGTTALGAPNTFGTTAPTGNALGVNAALFMGTTLARTNQTTTAAGVLDVNIVGSLGVTNSATNGSFFRITDNTQAITAAVSALGTAPTGTEVMAVNNVNLPNASSGAALSSSFINATGAAVTLKASTGNLYGFSLTNGTAAAAFIEFFNVATTPTLGTTAVVFCIPLPASANVTLPPSTMALFNFSAGISFAVTTAENGATTAAVTGMIFYK
jgi:hypothetical protein